MKMASRKKKAFADYKSNDNEHSKKMAFWLINQYQVRMYGVFFLGYLSEQDDIFSIYAR